MLSLVESPVSGIVMRTRPTAALIVSVIKDWHDAGGARALVAAKPDAHLHGAHWVSMPRSILKKHDVSLGVLGAAKIVAMYIRVAEVLSRVDDGAPAAAATAARTTTRPLTTPP